MLFVNFPKHKFFPNFIVNKISKINAHVYATKVVSNIECNIEQTFDSLRKKPLVLCMVDGYAEGGEGGLHIPPMNTDLGNPETLIFIYARLQNDNLSLFNAFFTLEPRRDLKPSTRQTITHELDMPTGVKKSP